jgi:hypothetical protein
MTLAEAIERLNAKFRSCNSVPVARAPITAEEWSLIRAALEQSEKKQ